MSRAYEYRHIVGFEETNLVGNVYFVNHIRWQGRCREMFLRDHAPEVLVEMENGLCLATASCSCDYVKELAAFDEVIIRMRLRAMGPFSLTMNFDYVRFIGEIEEVVARGEQKVAFMRREGGQMVATPIPVALREALRPFSEERGQW